MSMRQREMRDVCILYDFPLHLPFNAFMPAIPMHTAAGAVVKTLLLLLFSHTHTQTPLAANCKFSVIF